MWDWLERHRRATILVLVALLLVGGALFFYHQRTTPGGAVELTHYPQQIQVYVDGAVEHPGVYTLGASAQLIDLIEVAGVTAGADLSGFDLAQRLVNGDRIHIYSEDEFAPQKVNINTAEEWLLEALHGIGEVRAQNIVTSREEDGLFLSTYELVERNLIPLSVYDDIKDLITV
jgi:competence protein ComEA